MFSRFQNYRVLESIAECYRVLQSITKCYRVLQSVTECYRVFLAHLLGPIFGHVYLLVFVLVLVEDHWRLKYTKAQQSQQMAFKQSPSLSNNPIYSYQLFDLYSVVRCICVLLCHFEGCFPVQNYLCIADGAVLASSLKYEASFLCLSKIFTHGRIHRLLSTTSSQRSHSAE